MMLPYSTRLTDAVDDLADAVLVFLVLALALGLADLAGHDLAGHLGLDPAELEGRQDLFVGLADDGVSCRRAGRRQARSPYRLLEVAVLVLELGVVARPP